MRKRFIHTIVILSLFASCRAQKIDRELLYGTFKAVDQNRKGLPAYFYTLVLNQDSTFSFNISVDLGGSHCSGEWKITDDKVLLECNEVADPMVALTRGGMRGVQPLEIVGKNKLKYKDVVLKRKSE